MLERQFQGYFDEASSTPGVTGENLLRMLELRLDNVVYRMGFAASRAEARQMVGHAHFAVNGRVSNIPSLQLKPGDKIEVRETHRTREPFKEAVELIKSRQIPEWLSVDAAEARRLRRQRAAPRPDAARSQRAARGRVLLEVRPSPMIELETAEPADRAGRGARLVRQVRGQPAAGRLRRHSGQRPATRPAVLARGRGRDGDPDP